MCFTPRQEIFIAGQQEQRVLQRNQLVFRVFDQLAEIDPGLRVVRILIDHLNEQEAGAFALTRLGSLNCQVQQVRRFRHAPIIPSAAELDYEES